MSKCNSLSACHAACHAVCLLVGDLMLIAKWLLTGLPREGGRSV